MQEFLEGTVHLRRSGSFQPCRYLIVLHYKRETKGWFNDKLTHRIPADPSKSPDIEIYLSGLVSIINRPRSIERNHGEGISISLEMGPKVVAGRTLVHGIRYEPLQQGHMAAAHANPRNRKWGPAFPISNPLDTHGMGRGAVRMDLPEFIRCSPPL